MPWKPVRSTSRLSTQDRSAGSDRRRYRRSDRRLGDNHFVGRSRKRRAVPSAPVPVRTMRAVALPSPSVSWSTTMRSPRAAGHGGTVSEPPPPPRCVRSVDIDIGSDCGQRRCGPEGDFETLPDLKDVEWNPCRLGGTGVEPEREPEAEPAAAPVAERLRGLRLNACWGTTAASNNTSVTLIARSKSGALVSILDQSLNRPGRGRQRPELTRKAFRCPTLYESNRDGFPVNRASYISA